MATMFDDFVKQVAGQVYCWQGNYVKIAKVLPLAYGHYLLQCDLYDFKGRAANPSAIILDSQKHPMKQFRCLSPQELVRMKSVLEQSVQRPTKPKRLTRTLKIIDSLHPSTAGALLGLDPRD